MNAAHLIMFFFNAGAVTPPETTVSDIRITNLVRRRMR